MSRDVFARKNSLFFLAVVVLYPLSCSCLQEDDSKDNSYDDLGNIKIGCGVAGRFVCIGTMKVKIDENQNFYVIL